MSEPVAVTLYTRADCSLCDTAKASMRAAQSLYRLDIVLTETDIDGDPVLKERYRNDIPVIFIGGVEAFRHRVRPDEFAEAVRGAGVRPGKASVVGLATESCVPCRGGVPPLRGSDLVDLGRELGPGWQVVEEHHLSRERSFPDFASALAFTNAVGAIAEREGHHPDIHLAWGKVRIEIWTHAIDGLTRSDFVLAAKIDEVE